MTEFHMAQSLCAYVCVMERKKEVQFHKCKTLFIYLISVSFNGINAGVADLGHW